MSKAPIHLLIAVLILASLIACVSTPTRNYTVSIPETARKADILEIVIDAAKSAGLPPATKIDKANGLVEFGNFGMPEIGVTAQVRIRSENSLDVTVKRTSLYTSLPIEKTASEFKTQIVERLAKAQKDS